MLIKPDIPSYGATSSVRKDVLGALSAPIKTRSAPQTKKANDAQDVDIDALQSGVLKIHSSSIPHLLGQQSYDIRIKQRVVSKKGEVTDVDATFNTTRRFLVDESPWSLDPATIHSVYPPPGHPDYANVLPHVTLNDPSIPWSIQPSIDTSESSSPWLALMTFSEHEIVSSPQSLQYLMNTTKATRTPTGAISLSIGNLAAASTANEFSIARSFSASDQANPNFTQVFLVDKALFSDYFSMGTSSQPSFRRFKRMSHVRTVNTAGMVNRDAKVEEAFSVVVGPRTGPLQNTVPEIVHAHLVSLYGLHELQLDSSSTTPVALSSLHSWSYMSLPVGGKSVTELMQDISKDIAPLRCPASQLATPSVSSPEIDDWIKNRILAGYAMIEHDTIKGAPTYAMQRGPLVPFKPTTIDFPPSDSGSDLAVIDPKTGFLDLTYQLAWELGRTLISTNTAVAAAIMKLRTSCHKQAMNVAKTTEAAKLLPANAAHVSTALTLQNMKPTFDSLVSFKESTTPPPFQANRWSKKSTLEGKIRKNFVLGSPSVQQAYRSHLQQPKASFSRAVSATQNVVKSGAKTAEVGDTEASKAHYNEMNAPNSVEYAQLLSWCNDAWYFGGIPYHYLIPDPIFIPKESIRTFYVDANWFKVFFDGALSITEHFTPDDDVREAIKLNLDDYINTELAKGHPKPPIPRWGFFIRSELVMKFSDMRIIAPRSHTDPGFGKTPECIRKETLGTDLVLALFDREPTSEKFPAGVTIHGPEHQICNMLGEIGDLTATTLELKWKHATDIDLVNAKTSSLTLTAESTLLRRPVPDIGVPDIFDFNTRLLDPDALATLVTTTIKDKSEQGLGLLDRKGWTVTADSYEPSDMADPDYPVAHSPAHVLDGKNDTRWHTQWVDPYTSGDTDGAPLPHWIQIDMGKAQVVAGLLYKPRQDGGRDGMIGRYEIYTSNDGNFGNTPTAAGEWACSATDKIAKFTPTDCRFVRLKSLTESQNNGNRKTSCAELNLLTDLGFSSSLLNSQLLSITPKLTIACEEAPQTIVHAVPSFTSSKARPSRKPAAAHATKLTPIVAPKPTSSKARSQRKPAAVHTAKVSTSSAAATPTPTPTFPSVVLQTRTPADQTPLLSGLARVELDQAWTKDRQVWNRIISLIGEGRSIWTTLSSRDNAPASHLSPTLAINIYNVRTVATAPTTLFTPNCVLMAPRPMTYGFKNNIYFSLQKAFAPNLVGNLSSVEISVPTSSSSGISLIPAFEAHQTPRVRMLGVGRKRWAVSKTVLRESTGSFYITIVANKGDPTATNAYEAGSFWDVEKEKMLDLSFVIEDVQIIPPNVGAGMQHKFEATVAEIYVKADGGLDYRVGMVGQWITALDVDSERPLDPAPAMVQASRPHAQAARRR